MDQAPPALTTLAFDLIPNKDPFPCGRQGTAYVDYGTSIIVFGGRIADTRSGPRKSSRNYTNDLWSFDFEGTWTRYTIDPSFPCPRMNHSAVLFEDKLWIFGGAGYEGIFNDLHCYDLKEKKWEKIQATEVWPPPVHGHTAVVYDGKMVVFGGGSRVGDVRVYFDDLWVYSFADKTWEKRECPLGPRAYHSASIIDETMFIFGGFTMKGKIESYFNDFWQCDLNTFQWVQRFPKTSVVPSPRNRQSCIPYVVNGQRALLFFGGNYYNVQTRQGGFYKDAYLCKISQSVADEKFVDWVELKVTGKVPGMSNHIAVLHDGVLFIGFGEAKRLKFHDHYRVFLK